MSKQENKLSLVSFIGPNVKPARSEDVDELVRRDNEIALLRRQRDALAANLFRRVDGQGGEQFVGPHWLQVRRSSDGERRRADLMVDGVRRWREESIGSGGE